MTALAKKLGLKPTTQPTVLNPPKNYESLLGVPLQTRTPTNFLQVFVTTQLELQTNLPDWLTQITPEAHLWITYPKKPPATPATSTVTQSAPSWPPTAGRPSPSSP